MLEGNAIPIITAFEKSPDRGQGLARDMTVRWALEEVGQPYKVRLLSFKELKEKNHRLLHPFGQIPTFEEGDLTLFESGAILLYIAESRAGLLPEDRILRSRVIMWIFAALSTIEPSVVELSMATFFDKDKIWHEERLPILQNRVRERLRDLSNHLGANDWLDNQFYASDLMMISVLRRLKKSGLLNEFPNLNTYVVRGEERPAFKKAFAAQLTVYQESLAT